MSRRSRENEHPRVAIGSDVIRQIRRHARSSSKTEVCGVLVGRENSDSMEVEACISGLNAEQAGAHVTFTQDTWEHIYKIKDQQYPDQRIVGWYHSHPGFGIFLSDHDTFIHKNFFSSPGQVAWVCDPHSDEEGCFGWVNGRIERLTQIRILDRQGGEAAQVGGRPEPILQQQEDEPVAGKAWEPEPKDSEMVSLSQLTVTILSHLSVLILGLVIGWYVFPRVVMVPVPVDPLTGQPLVLRQAEPVRPGTDLPQNGQGTSSKPPSKPGAPDAGKEGHDQR
jgi:proteasome lid subunit RPN8/RPN11